MRPFDTTKTKINYRKQLALNNNRSSAPRPIAPLRKVALRTAAEVPTSACVPLPMFRCSHSLSPTPPQHRPPSPAPCLFLAPTWPHRRRSLRSARTCVGACAARARSPLTKKIQQSLLVVVCGPLPTPPAAPAGLVGLIAAVAVLGGRSTSGHGGLRGVGEGVVVGGGEPGAAEALEGGRALPRGLRCGETGVGVGDTKHVARCPSIAAKGCRGMVVGDGGVGGDGGRWARSEENRGHSTGRM